jgi:DNA gyrase inhibitor GyrI
MNQIAQISSGWTSRQLDTIKRTVAHDTNEDEFNLFIEYARSKRLDPFSKQIIAVVYSKDNPEEAQDDDHRHAGRPARACLPLPRL